MISFLKHLNEQIVGLFNFINSDIEHNNLAKQHNTDEQNKFVSRQKRQTGTISIFSNLRHSIREYKREHSDCHHDHVVFSSTVIHIEWISFHCLLSHHFTLYTQNRYDYWLIFRSFASSLQVFWQGVACWSVVPQSSRVVCHIKRAMTAAAGYQPCQLLTRTIVYGYPPV